MDVLLNYKFSKPFVSQTELIELFGSLSESTLKRYMKEWIDSGNEVKDMGMFRLDKVRENQWEPVTFMKWLYEQSLQIRLRNKTTGSSQRRLLATYKR